MAPSFRFGRMTALFFLFLSLFNIALAAPTPGDTADTGIDHPLVARTAKTITKAQYVAYLKKYFPQ
jgi:hypothetical protein